MKRNYWPLFFISIFSFTFGMIVWTIISTQKANLDEDKSFLKSYQDVDEYFNEFIYSNKEFRKKYDLVFTLNTQTFPLTTEDIMYSQRVLEKKSKHKGALKLGKNSLVIYAVDKVTKAKKALDIELKVTKSNVAAGEFILLNDNFFKQNNIYSTSFDIKEENNWNITGSFKIANDIGYIYIKTNAL